MKVLIGCNDYIYAFLIKSYIEKMLLFVKCDIVNSFTSIKEKLDYDLYIVDYVLPDTQKEEHVKYLLEYNKKVIVLAQFESEIEKSEIEKKIVDFFIKDDVSTLNYLVNFVKRLYKNKYLNVLVADKSLYIKEYEKYILQNLNLNVIEFDNIDNLLEHIEHKDINFLILDSALENIVEILKEIRKKRSMDKLPILIVTEENKMDITINLLKFGANDFIKKPFLKEEFTIRIKNILDLYDYLMEYKEEAFIDGLTGVYNRKFLESEFDRFFKIYNIKSIAMLDIDFFKKINDTYGHQVGDEVLKHFAKTIKSSIRKGDFVIRYGGEEFLIFMPNTSKTEALKVLEKIKNALTPVGDVKFTFSAGIADEGKSVVEMIKNADKRLYMAKEMGRNRIIIE